MRMMTHLARADEEEGVRSSGSRKRARHCLTPRSIANSAGVIRYSDVGGDYAAPRDHALRIVALPLQLRRTRSRSGHDAQERIDRHSGHQGRTRALGYGGTYILHRAPTASSARSPAGTPTRLATLPRTGRARLREESAHGGQGVDGHDDGSTWTDAPQAVVGSPGRALGRRARGRRRRRCGGAPSAINSSAASRVACPSSPPRPRQGRHRALRGISCTLSITGSRGFIGSNLVKALNARGERSILAVDNLTKGEKSENSLRLRHRRLHRQG